MIKSIMGNIVRSDSIIKNQITFDDDSGLIVDVGDLKIPYSQVDYHFHEHCLIFPGMGDVHVHAREDASEEENYKEDFNSAAAAALNGGVLHFWDMPNNPRPPVNDYAYEKKFALTLKSPIPICLYAGIGPHTFPLKLKIPYKVYMAPSVGDLFFENQQQLEKVLQRYQGEHISFHCEDPQVLINHQDDLSHETRRPVQAEILATDRALYYTEKFGLKAKLCHFSTGDGLMLIKGARKKGINVECEVTPQHLFFNQEQLSKMSPTSKQYFQMNPPIRFSKDQEALMESLRAGEIDYLATDHAPHTMEEKQNGISGLTGLDTYGPFVTWLIKNQSISPLLINKMCSENPGKFFNQFLPTFKQLNSSYHRFGKGLGFIEKDYSATFTVLNLEKPITITKEYLKTKPRHSPFEGITFPGSVEKIFYQGRLM